jgi:arabinofuranosyltransferase
VRRPGGARVGTALAVAAVVAGFSWVFYRNAWLGDDDFITFRSVEQLFAGHGPRWNPHERVQAFTHPLWFGLLAAGRSFVHDVFWSSLGLAYACAAAALAVAWRILDGDAWRWALVVGTLLSSKAFVDYCSTGLENALSFLLLAVFLDLYLGLFREPGAAMPPEKSAGAPAAAVWKPGRALREAEPTGRGPHDAGHEPDRASGKPGRTTWQPGRAILALSTTASLVALCRHDLLLLCAPPLLAAIWQQRRAGVRAAAVGLALGALPLLAWTAFAVCWYGFPFPNTAYAKLGTGIPASELWRQGLHYLDNARRWDPLTLAVCLAGIVLPPLRRRRWIPVACGLAAYLVYVVAIGGDFMAGRFLSQVFWLSCLALGSCLPEGAAGRRLAGGNDARRLAAGAGTRGSAAGASGARLVAGPSASRLAVGAGALALVVYHLAVPGLPVTVGPGYSAPYPFRSAREHGIADEKGLYFRQLSLAAHRAGVPLGPPPAPEAVAVEGAIGVQGYLAGTERILIDPNGLADPLLARLPAARPWRIGHFRRELPAGYVESVAGGSDRIADPAIRRLYERLVLVTRGPLWRRERWQAIWELNRF